MQLSVVITTRNRKEALKACISSVAAAAAGVGDWELIIVDDCSSDGTGSLDLAALGVPQGRLIRCAVQQMMVAARNIGARAAKGEYVLFVDDDNEVDPGMIERLIESARANPRYGIIGPSMHYFDGRVKYLDYQKINFFTGRTRGIIDRLGRAICDSDGVPNVFMIRRSVFESCGYFDEKLIQTFTEPDFAFHAAAAGHLCGITPDAKTYHKIPRGEKLSPRVLGAEFPQKAYCLIRNRSWIIARHGKTHHKIVYWIFFSWLWPTIYSLLILPSGRFDLIRLYWKGFWDGLNANGLSEASSRADLADHLGRY
ncbi:MAG: hypothetical protein A2V88_07120 [Elusimicrobia bacterium RBG_16_66_12]|nr:MAG: hypothetical protein A2V88_07120 [Elusimicrobia bacterium RBG_16_66_12]